MRAIWINSTRNSIIELQLSDEDVLSSLQKYVGGYITVAVDLPNGDTIYVDDEGLLKGNVDFFEHKLGYQPYAGNGVIVNTTKSGKSASAKSSITDIRNNITFTDIWELKKRYA